MAPIGSIFAQNQQTGGQTSNRVIQPLIPQQQSNAIPPIIAPSSKSKPVASPNTNQSLLGKVASGITNFASQFQTENDKQAAQQLKPNLQKAASQITSAPSNAFKAVVDISKGISSTLAGLFAPHLIDPTATTQQSPFQQYISKVKQGIKDTITAPVDIAKGAVNEIKAGTPGGAGTVANINNVPPVKTKNTAEKTGVFMVDALSDLVSGQAGGLNQATSQLLESIFNVPVISVNKDAAFKAVAQKLGVDGETILRNKAASVINEYAGSDLKASSSLDDIKAVYRDLSSKLHPDVGGNVQDFTRVTNAYQYLTGKLPDFQDLVSGAGTSSTPTETKLLGNGTIKTQFTPNEVADYVVKNDLGNDPVGKKLMLSVADAQQTGQDVINIVPTANSVAIHVGTPEVKYVDPQVFAPTVKAEPGGSVTINSLKLPDNADINRVQVEAVKSSILAGDKINPLVVDSQNVVQDGAHRLTALKELGIDQAQVVKETTVKPKVTTNEMQTGKIVGRAEKTTDAIRTAMSEADTPDAALASLNKYVDSFTKGADAQQLADLKAGINKEIKTLIGGTGDYRKDYAIQVQMRSDTEIGPLVTGLEKHVSDLNSKIEAMQPKPAVKETPRVVGKAELGGNEIGVPRSQLPIGEGKLKASRLEARVKGVLDNLNQDTIDRLNLSTFNQMNKNDTIAKAAELVTNNPEDALKMLAGELEIPQGLNPNSIFVAMTQNPDLNVTIATKVASLMSTAQGQNLSILTELDPNSPIKIVSDIYKVKEAQLQKQIPNQTPKQVIKAKVDKAVAKMKAPKIADWNSLIAEIRC